MDLSDYRRADWLKGKTILIAEDDPTNYRLLVAMLKHSGAELEWVQTGDAALSIIREKPADKNYIVLMDIKMPVMDGYEAYRQIRETDQETPVIAVTAYAQSQDRDRIMKSNFDGYITKPINLQALVKILTSIINR